MHAIEIKYSTYPAATPWKDLIIPSGVLSQDTLIPLKAFVKYDTVGVTEFPSSTCSQDLNKNLKGNSISKTCSN